MEAKKLVAMKGFLRVERLGRVRMVSLDIDLKRNSSRSLQFVGCKALVMGEDIFPIERLRLGPATKAVLVLSGINTLSKIPRNIDDLRALPLNDEQIRELLDELRAFGYILHGGRTLLWQKPRQTQQGPGWIIQSFLTKQVKELNVNPKIWMKLSSRGIQTIEQLCECAESDLKYVHHAGKDIESKLRLKQDELEEIKGQLEYFGLSLKDKGQEKTERWSGLWEEDMRLLKARASNQVTLEQAKKILKNQYELFLGLREAKTTADRIAWRNAIVERNLGWVTQAVRYVVPEMIRQEDPCMDFDDLFQEGAIGCMRGVSLYDMTSGYGHTTYLTKWIRSMAQRFILETAGIPVHRSESLAQLRKAYKTLRFLGNHSPDAQALAEAMGTTSEEVEKLLILVQIGFDKHCKTLDLVVVTDEHGNNLTLGDETPSYFSEWPELIEESDRNLDLKKAVLHILDTAPLVPIEREILEFRFGLKDGVEHTLEAIAEKYGVTRERIRQREEDALEQLRTVEAYHRVKELVPKLLSPSVVISDALWLDAVDCWKYLLEMPQGTRTLHTVLDAIAGFFERDSKKILTLASQGRPAVAQYVFVSFCMLELEVSRGQLAEIIGYRFRRLEGMRRELCLKFKEMGYAVEKGSITSLASRPVTKESMVLSLQNVSLNSIEEILNAVAHEYGVSLDDLQSKAGRLQENVEARFEAIYQLRTILKLSFSRIAEVLGYDNHTSVIHGYQKAKEKRWKK